MRITGETYCGLINFLNEPVDPVSFPAGQIISIEFESDFSVQHRGAWFKLTGMQISLMVNNLNIIFQ